MQSKSSIIILIVTILVVGGGLAYYFLGRDSETAPTSGLVSTNTGAQTGVTTASTGSGSAGDQVVAMLRNLSTLQLNDEVFKTPSFSLLKDMSMPISPVTTQGRPNPFAPVLPTAEPAFEATPAAATPAAR